MSRNLRTLKGVEKKTEKLLHKAGIADVEGLSPVLSQEL